MPLSFLWTVRQLLSMLSSLSQYCDGKNSAQIELKGFGEIAMRCSKCRQDVPEDQTYVHLGETLCEDCYLEAINRVKACDPWAVYHATRVRENMGLEGTEGLTELQKAIHEFIKSRGRATGEEVMGNLGLSQQEMETNFAILRHCELIRAYKENGKIYLTTLERGQ